MLIVRTDTGQKLKDMLDAMREMHSGWRAVHFRFSLIKEKLKTLSIDKIAFGIINESLQEKDGNAFFFADGDIFILCRSLVRKEYERLVLEFESFMGAHLKTDDGKELAILFDLSIEWPSFKELCKKKINAAAADTENGTVSTLSILSPPARPASSGPAYIDPTLRKDVHERRLQRRQTCVLVVEDDPLSQRLTRNALQGDYTVVGAENGHAAQKSYLENAPDIVFLDIGLPDMNGHDVLQALLKIDPSAYIVMLSGNSYKEDIINAMQRGAKGFVGKPFSRDKLLQYVRHCPTHVAPASASL